MRYILDMSKGSYPETGGIFAQAFGNDSAGRYPKETPTPRDFPNILDALSRGGFMRTGSRGHRRRQLPARVPPGVGLSMARTLVVAAAQTGSVVDGDGRAEHRRRRARHARRGGARRRRPAHVQRIVSRAVLPESARGEFRSLFHAPRRSRAGRPARPRPRRLGLRWSCRSPSAPAPATSMRRWWSTSTGASPGTIARRTSRRTFRSTARAAPAAYEKFYFTPGDALDVIDVAGVRIGVQICNDRLYPEGSRVLALNGAEMIVMPICFSTYADPAHRASIWEVPLRARAYENGAFVLACNRVGVEGPRHHLGRSMVVDPRGSIVCEAGTEAPELLVARSISTTSSAARKNFRGGATAAPTCMRPSPRSAERGARRHPRNSCPRR